jgi:hypothetical protein
MDKSVFILSKVASKCTTVLEVAMKRKTCLTLLLGITFGLVVYPAAGLSQNIGFRVGIAPPPLDFPPVQVPAIAVRNPFTPIQPIGIPSTPFLFSDSSGAAGSNVSDGSCPQYSAGAGTNDFARSPSLHRSGRWLDRYSRRPSPRLLRPDP